MKLTTTFFILFFTTLVFSQNWVRVDSVFSPSGVGSFHFTAPFFADMNDDGYADLLLGNTDDYAKFYVNKGEGIPPAFSYDETFLHSIYAGGAMGTNSYYPVAVDLDNDGDNDLVIGGYNGLIYYENQSTADSVIWNKIDTMFTLVNGDIGTDPNPAFADLDNDGDFDLFVGTGESLFGGPEAGIVISYRNIGTPRDPIFELDNTLSAGIGDVGLNCYPTFADINSNGTLDLLIGRDLKTFVYYTNTGTPEVPHWTNNDWFFAFPEANTYWKNPQLFDIDNDNDYDLIYGSDGGKIYMYENKGDSTAASFQYNASYFNVIKNDGSASTVSFADFDNDNDMDFISGNWFGDINYFENVGDVGNPAFQLKNNAISTLNVGTIYSTPTFVDIDSDGDFDIVSGALNGKILCYINNGSTFKQDDTTFADITASGSSTVSFADLDDDGDLDMVINGEASSDFKFFVNEGNNKFTQYDDLFSSFSIPSRATVKFADPDADGDYDLVMGKILGQIYYLENVGDAADPIFELNTDTFEGIEVLQNPAPDFADLNGDTKPDMIIGEYNGAFTFYANNFAVTSIKSDNKVVPESFMVSQNYPNPFNPETKIEYYTPEISNVNITVYDILGNQISSNNVISSAGYNVYAFSGATLASGIYIYRVTAYSDNGKMLFTSAKKMTLLK